MRIAYVLTSLAMGGAERVVVALGERMRARGHAVLLVVLQGRAPEEWPTTLDVVRLEMRKTPFGVAAALLRARGALRGFRPDLIHSHVFPANMAARLLRILLPETAIVSTVHNVYEGAWPRMLAYRLTDFLCRRTVAVSMAAAERFVRLRAIPAAKAAVLTNGIDIAEFAPNAARRARIREELGAGDDFIWLAAGRIVPAKDYPNLLCAFEQVRAALPRVRLWIAGEASGQQSAEELISRARKSAEDLLLPGKKRQGTTSAVPPMQQKECGALAPAESTSGIFPPTLSSSELPESDAIQAPGEAVRWLGLRRDMPALLDAADGFVLASAWEGMPLVIGEAMAMEKPVAATDVGGVRELVGETGMIVPAKSPERLAEAMLELMRRSPEARRALGRAARERIAARFGVDAKVKEWEALYRAVLEKTI